MEAIREKIFDFAYSEALNDATRRVYKGKENVAEINEARNEVKNYINAILNGENPDFYSTASVVEKAINNDKSIKLKMYFNFGNTQKLINMTAKHFFMLCYQNDEHREKFKCCHCPMDSRMIYKARLILKAAGITRSPLKSDVAWSSITTKDEKSPIEYEVFQTAINAFCKAEGIIPIEFDYCYWQESNEDFSKELGKIMEDEKKKTALIKELKEATGK